MPRTPLPGGRYLPALGLCLLFGAVWLGIVVYNKSKTPPPPPASEPPKIVRQTPAKYPAALARLGIDGKVTLAVQVDAEGRSSQPRVVGQSNPGFVLAALEALESCTFQAATKEGEAVAGELEVDFLFGIERDAGDDRGTELWTVNPPDKWEPSVPENFRFEEAPYLLNTVFAAYPRTQLSAGAKAQVDMGLVVDPSGRILRMTVLNADAPDWAVLAARAMYGSWRLNPARRQGQPCYAGVRTSVTFEPDGSGSVPVSPATRTLLAELAQPKPAVFTLEELDAIPQPYLKAQPPVAAWVPEAQSHGRVLVEFFISPRGEVLLPGVLAAPNAELGAFAIQTVQGWVFGAPRKGGQPVTVRVTVPLNY
jgi:TonB family protein